MRLPPDVSQNSYPSLRFNSRLQEELIHIQAHVDQLEFTECRVVEPNIIGVKTIAHFLLS